MRKLAERLLRAFRSTKGVPAAAAFEAKTLHARPTAAVLFVGFRLCQVGNMATGDFIEGGMWPAVIGRFRSSADHDLHVGASLSFADTTTGDEIVGAARGSWLDHHYNYSRFQPGQTQELLIAFAQDRTLMIANDRRAPDSSYGLLKTIPLPAGRLSVTIALFGDVADVAPTRCTFEWTTDGGFALS